MLETIRCKECYYYTSGHCNMELLNKRSVRPDDYCNYWMSEKTGNEYAGTIIICNIKNEKRKGK